MKKHLRERKSFEDVICGLTVVSTAFAMLVSSSSAIIVSVLVASVVVGLLVGLVRFVVTWGLFVVAPDAAVGFGFVVGFVGRTGFSDTDGFKVVRRLIGLFVVAGFFVVMYDGFVVVAGFRTGFFVVVAGLLVTVDAWLDIAADVALTRLYTTSLRSCRQKL